ncbi:MAG: hypothetical protein CMJ78_15940 [Planctomycetaceae bacterium]|nr:hypothetical protein [Planctomycetaceae bacterium]
MLQYTLILLPAGLAPGLGIFCHWLKTRSHKNTQAKVVLYVKKAQSAKQYRVISLIDPHTTTPQESAARRPNYDASYAASKTSPIWSPKSSNNEKGSSPHY